MERFYAKKLEVPASGNIAARLRQSAFSASRRRAARARPRQTMARSYSVALPQAVTRVGTVSDPRARLQRVSKHALFIKRKICKERWPIGSGMVQACHEWV